MAKEIIQKQRIKGPLPSRWDEVPMQYNIFEYKLLRTSIGSKGKLPTMEDGTAIANFFRETTTNITAFSYGVSAESLYERNLLELAKKDLELAIQYDHQYNDPGLLIPMYLLKAKIYIYEKQLVSAQAMLMQVTDMAKEKHWLMTIPIMQAYCYVLAGDSRGAKMELLATKTKQPFWMLVYARLLLLKEQPEDALSIVIQTKTKAQQDHQVATIMEASVLEAICHNRMGNTDVALAILHESLEQGAPYFYIRTFLDEKEIHPLLERYFKQLQEDGSKWKPISLYYLQQLQITDSTNIEMDNLLTPREQEVFNSLSEGITIVKSRKRLIYRKGQYVYTYLPFIVNSESIHEPKQFFLRCNKKGCSLFRVFCIISRTINYTVQQDSTVYFK